ncbi:hypothetical protein C0995_015008 [Termitomyces sp. Mi166|nr:hypothetical protein C0995_015008 [Termitomyces sp. Mi166\
MYTPVPLLVLLALLAGALGLVPSPQAQAVVHTLLAASLGGSVLHLQVLAGARLPMLIIPVLLLVCATVLSFFPRLSPVPPVLFLAFILATLCITVYLFLAHRNRSSAAVTLPLTPAPPSPASSHTSFEKPSLRSSPLLLVLVLSAQLSYALATAFCIPPALHTSPGPASPLVLSLVSVSSTHAHLSSTYIFRILDTAFTVLSLVFVFAAYYPRSRSVRRPDVEHHPIHSIITKLVFSSNHNPAQTHPASIPPCPPVQPSPSSLPTPSTPPTSPLRLSLPPGTRMSPGPAAHSPVVVIPLPSPVICKQQRARAWSWHTPCPPAGDSELEGDFTDLRDPFAPVPIPTLPSAYRGAGVGARDVASRCRSSSESATMECGGVGNDAQTYARTRMSTWGRLPLCRHAKGRGLKIDTSLAAGVEAQAQAQSAPVESASPGSVGQKVRFNFVDGATTSSNLNLALQSTTRPRTPKRKPHRHRDHEHEQDAGAAVGTRVGVGVGVVSRETECAVGSADEDALIAQTLLVRLGNGGG